MPEHHLSLLHVVASINPRIGGPALSVTGLAEALARRGYSTTVASLDYREHGTPVGMDAVSTIHFMPGRTGRMLRGWSPQLSAAIHVVATRPVDIIHNHGLWMFPNVYARRAANRSQVPLVTSPRGMLDAWSLGRSRFRKGIASIAFENKNLASARLFHATSEDEARAIRRHGLKQPIAVIPNGVDVANELSAPPRASLEERFQTLKGRRWLLFMGRLDPKKGLDTLLDAWRVLHAEFPEWHLIVVGPDLVGYGAGQLAKAANEPSLLRATTFTGMLQGDDKQIALAHADVFVLPTRSENFGIAVAEALGAGTPVITTTAAPWAGIATRDCGWWVEPQPDAIREAIRSALRRSPEELAARGQIGRQWMHEEFSWDYVGERMAEAYRWILTGGTTPACVQES